MTAVAMAVITVPHPGRARSSWRRVGGRTVGEISDPVIEAALGRPSTGTALAKALGDADIGTRARALQHLQRANGNAFVQRFLADTIAIQRCGAIPCNCPAEEEPLALQRAPICDEETGECEEDGEDGSSTDQGSPPDPTGIKRGPGSEVPPGTKLGPAAPPKPGVRGPFIDTCFTDPDGFPAQVGDPGGVCLLPGESINQLCFYDENGDLKTPCAVVSAPITPVPGVRGPAIDTCFTDPEGLPAPVGDPGSVCEFTRNPEQLCFYDENGDLKSPCVVVEGPASSQPVGRPGAGRGALTVGSSGPQVSEVQAALNARNAPIAEDGVFSAEMKGAVIKFQAQQRLAPDGIVGPQTKAALGLEPTGGLLTVGSSGPAVAEVQAALNATDAPIAEDGVFGMETRGAVIKFQAQQDLTPDGIVGAQTKAALGLESAAAA
jgi:peptidoglycan hydrolase-like protein with peptidoglycan-binding domain